MELIWKEIEAERLISNETVQVHIEGELPSPDGRTPIEIPIATARVIVEGASADAGEIRISGRIAVQVTATDESNTPFAFESSAGFTHRIECGKALPGMRAMVSPSVQSIAVTPAASGASISAAVDLNVRLVSAVPLKVTGGIAGVKDLEIKTKTVNCTSKQLIGSDTLRLREELSAEGIGSIVNTEGQINVRDVSIEQGAAAVSGTITVSAVTVDGAGRFGQLIRQIPFREKIALNLLADRPYCTASIDSIYLRALGEEFALVSMEAQVTFSVFGLTEKELTLPVDAFSPSIGFDCLYDEAMLLSCEGNATEQLSLKETIPLPDNASEMAAPLFVTARPLVTSVDVDGESISIEGVLATTAAFESASGRCYTFTEDVPFSASIDNPTGADMPLVTASCSAQITGTAERALQIQYSLLLNSEILRTERIEVVTGLAERELPERKSGIVISFASSGEDVFDAAKRYGVSCESVRKLNPDIKEPFLEGDKLIILV
ncbi:MAG: hypothetical protein K6G56_06425 [Clostridiales bacterium]|nr:hypothetical protein [Clostridiales bacterium]